MVSRSGVIMNKLQQLKKLGVGLFLFLILFVNPAQSQRASVNVINLAESPNSTSLKVLFIGNSLTYTNQTPLIFCNLVSEKDPGIPLKITEVVASGVTLEEQWQDGTAARVINQQGPWNYVVLQEQSSRSWWDPEKTATYFRLFEEQIHRAGAKTILFETWCDEQELQYHDALRAKFQTLVSKTHSAVAPVGDAWIAAKRDCPDAQLYQSDGHHPSLTGAYLAACVFYGKLLGKSPEGVANTLTLPSFYGLEGNSVNLSEEMARELQRTAWRAVLSSN
jgi:hypothetical protein